MEKSLFYQTPPVYTGLWEKVEQIKQSCTAVKVFTAGKSVLGKKIPVLSFGNITKAKGGVLFAGTFHALEWINTLLLLRFCEEIAGALEKQTQLGGFFVNKILQQQCLMVVPCVNVDGMDLVNIGIEAAGSYKNLVQQAGNIENWQANIRGVDINHNFNAGYPLVKKMEEKAGITGPAPTRWGGTKAESEPETRAITALCKKYCFSSVYAFHSQGEEIYYQYQHHEPFKSQIYAQLLANASGYKLSIPVKMASHGGFKDWFIQTYHKCGFTIETGNGKNPLPITDFEGIYEKIRPLLLLAMAL